MDDYSKLQILLLQWLKHHEIRTIDQIRVSSKSLLISYNFDPKNALLKVFYPLVRKGFIEFIGNGKYHIANAVVIYFPKKKIAVGVNLTNYQLDKIRNGFKIIREDEFGIVRFELVNISIKTFKSQFKVLWSEPEIGLVLRNFPKIKDIVDKFERVSNILEGEYFDVIKHCWSKRSNHSCEIFRTSSDSQRFYLRTNNQTQEIPIDNINPDARPLAECYQACCQGYDFLSYNRSTNELRVDNVNIPILIERLLLLASIYQEDGVSVIPGKTTFKNISYSAVKELNRIFGISTKIEI